VFGTATFPWPEANALREISGYQGYCPGASAQPALHWGASLRNAVRAIVKR